MSKKSGEMFFEKKGAAESVRLFKRCVVYFMPYKWHIVVAFVFMVVAGLCDAFLAWLMKPALDDIFINKDSTALFILPIIFIAITAVKALSRMGQAYLMQFSGLRVLETLRDEVFGKIIMLPLRFFEGAQVGMLMARIVNDVMAIRGSMPALVMCCRHIVAIVSLTFVVFYQNAELAFWAVIVLPAALFPFVFYGRRIRKLSRQSHHIVGEVSSLLQEVLSGVRVVKAFGTEREERARFDKENKRQFRNQLKRVVASGLSSSIMEVVGAIGVAAVIWIGGSQVISGKVTPGTIFSFAGALLLLYEPIKRLNGINQEIQSALAGAERVFGLLDDPDLTVERGGSLMLEPPVRTLRFDGVSFSYSDGTRALRDISFTINEGERVAIVGPSGAGKTTFVNLIPRFYEAQQGRILLNDRPLEEYELASLRKHISIVSQDSFLFNLSVTQNIAYGMHDYSMDAVIAAAKAAYADEFIEHMPQGYDTVVGERGVILSGGQKQRLTIARAIMKNAPILILDEATSALDSESEHVVQQALENLMQGRTSIVIAHRLSTVISADRILVMEQGRIVAQGPHAELLHTSHLYAKLYEMQFNVGTGA
ncbi:ABC transporter ATP-binding protein/permease [Desulfovibrio sp. OttesenSCG-928-A18]|nr:ABC transporter ATP-binding protein/permease [Desulfovibrio sp. OttesenSCG-928-A18]